MRVLVSTTITGSGKESCQDSIWLEEMDNLLVFALSDGAGSAPFATEGAAFITERFVSRVSRSVEICEEKSALPKRAELRVNHLLKILREEIYNVRRELTVEAITKLRHVEDYAATFVGGVVYRDPFGSSVVIYFSVGDSVLFAFNEETKVIHSNPIVGGEYSFETVFLTSAEFENVLAVGIVENPKWILVASDGIDGIFYSQKFCEELKEEELPYYDRYRWCADVEGFENLSKLIKGLSDGSINEEYLEKFLSGQEAMSINGDDKSLIVVEV